MFSSAHNRSRAVQAYRAQSAEGGVADASPHQLIRLLLEGLQQSINAARGALQRGDLALKGREITRAVDILEQGLLGALDLKRGGSVAHNLEALYDYCMRRLTWANLHNDDAALAEVCLLYTSPSPRD